MAASYKTVAIICSLDKLHSHYKVLPLYVLWPVLHSKQVSKENGATVFSKQTTSYLFCMGLLGIWNMHCFKISALRWSSRPRTCRWNLEDFSCSIINNDQWTFSQPLWMGSFHQLCCSRTTDDIRHCWLRLSSPWQAMHYIYCIKCFENVSNKSYIYIHIVIIQIFSIYTN